MSKTLAVLLVALASPLMAAGITSNDLAPMRWFEQVVPEALPPLKYPEYADALDKAQMQIQAGRYRLALQTLRLAKDLDAGKRSLLEAQALLETGQYTEALQATDTPAIAKGVPALLIRAQCMAELGQRKQAIELVRQIVNEGSKSPQAHALLGQLLDSTGQLRAAAAAYEWFDQQGYLAGWQQNELEGIESADDLVAIASSLDRLAVLNGLYRQRPDLHQQILAMFVRAYDVLDRRNADGHAYAGVFFLAHGDEQRAQNEFETALDVNGNRVSVWQMIGSKSIYTTDASTAEKAIGAIRAVNPEHPAAAMLEAQLQIVQHQPDEALRILEPLVARDPDNAELLSLQAACDAQRPTPEALTQRLGRIDALMPESSLAHTTAARTIIAMNRPKDAIPLLEEAIRRTPHWSMPRNLLAMVYMLGTDTEKARPVLKEAHDLDPFSADTTNYLRLLDTLATFKTNTTAHFAVRFNPKTDPFLADEILNYLEENYARICANFGHEPQERTFIELMSENEDFSVRATGRPWHATYAITLGPVITIIAPRKSNKTIGAFDWSDVLRHEFVHTVTLSQTGGRIPRWFTEGLAVSEQVTPLWNSRIKLLAAASNKDKLVPLHSLDAAIVRGKAPELGYSQGHWICKYVQERYGYGTVLGMLQGYHDGLTTDAVFSKCLGVDASQFDQQFALWAKQQIAKMGMDPESQQKVNGLKQQAEVLVKNQELAKARDVLEEAYQVCPVDPMVHQRLAGLYLSRQINLPEKALPHLQALDREQLRDNRFAMRLAKLYGQLGRSNDALISARRATELVPYDPAARELLADLLQKAGDAQGSTRQADIARQLATATGKKPEPAAAE